MSKVLQPYATGQLLCSGSCPIEHVAIPDANEFPKPKNGWPDIRGLNSLQYSRTTLLNRAAIEKAIIGYYRGLPRALRSQVHIETSGISTLFNPGAQGKSEFQNQVVGKWRWFRRNIRAKEYTIWPINIGNYHWVTAVIHKGKIAGQDDYGRVLQVGYYDPWRQSDPSGRRKLVMRRLQEWLIRACRLQISKDWWRDVWVPSQLDGTSCGPRCYWAAKQFMDRLLGLHEAGRSYHENLWNPHSGWYDNEFVRAEMVGRVAWEAVASVEYNARVSVELVNKVQHENDSGTLVSASQTFVPPDYGEDAANWPKPQEAPIPTPIAPAQPTGSSSEATTYVEQILGSKQPSEPKIASNFSSKPGMPKTYITLEGEEPPVTKDPVWAPGPKSQNPYVPPKPPANAPKPKPPPHPQPATLFAVQPQGFLSLFSGTAPGKFT